MSLDALNQEAASTGGSWLTLYQKADGTIDATVVSFEKRPRTNPKGDVVYKNGTQNPRYVWTFTLQLDEDDPRREGPDDDGLRKWDANESAQRAIAAAIKACGHPAKEGDRLKVAVKEEAPPGEFKQADYKAVWTHVPASLAIDTEPDESDW